VGVALFKPLDRLDDLACPEYKVEHLNYCDLVNSSLFSTGLGTGLGTVRTCSYVT
jgi:hypothetical protein